MATVGEGLHQGECDGDCRSRDCTDEPSLSICEPSSRVGESLLFVDKSVEGGEANH